MKRRLIVMRHAKSSWETDAESDHERPLNKRGRRDAPRVAAHLCELQWQPQLVLSSDSRRTTETFELMKSEFSEEVVVDFLPSLYHAGVEEFLEEIVRVDDKVVDVMVLGHNPGWESVVQWLSGEGVSMTTANAALLEGSGESWSEGVATSELWSLREVIRPREL